MIQIYPNLKQLLSTDVYSANWWLKTGLDPASSRVRQIPRSHFQRSVVRGSAKILWRFWFSRGRTCSRCATRTSPCSPSPIWLILSSNVVNFHLTHSWVLSLSIFFLLLCANSSFDITIVKIFLFFSLTQSCQGGSRRSSPSQRSRPLWLPSTPAFQI